MQTAVAILVLVLIGLVAAQVASGKRFRARALTYVADLGRSTTPRPLGTRLPPRIADFARRAGADPAKPMRLASINVTAQMRPRPGRKFRPVVARQVISLYRAGFVWDARVTTLSTPGARILDAYHAAEAVTEARNAVAWSGRRETGPGIDMAAAFRYLVDLPMVPDAILGNPDLRWRMTSPDTAEVSLPVAGGLARAVFRLDDRGDIVEVMAPRGPLRGPDRGNTPYLWRGHYSEYHQIGPRRVPGRIETGFDLPSGFEVQFKGDVTDYHLAP